MKFYEAIKELLDGETIWRMNYDPEYDEVLRDEISFDGKDIHLRKSRITVLPDLTTHEKVLRDIVCQGALKIYSDELVATDWNIKDNTCSAEEALRAFREGKWIKHKTHETFFRKFPSDPNVYQRYWDSPSGSGSGMRICQEDMTWFTVRDLFLFKDGWIISDKETPT